MLVISNGAIKSGSTWLFMILRSMTNYSAPPKDYWNPSWKYEVVYSINPKLLAKFLKNVDYSSNHYLSKNHLGRRRHRSLLLSHEDVFVLDIERDVRDVVVSAYYHFRKLENFDMSFETFYWERGREIARSVINHHLLWRVNSPKVYVSSYERLKLGFNLEVKKIGKFLGFDLSEQEIERIKRETAIEKLSKESSKWNEKTGRYRKGIIGDWQNHLSPEMLEDIENIKKDMSNPFRRSLINFFSVPQRAYRKVKRLAS